MKKRIVALFSVALLVAGMTMTAAAAPSVTGSGIIIGIEDAQDEQGTDVTVVVEQLSATAAAEVESIKSTATLKKVLGDKYQAGMKVADLKEVRVVGDASLIDWPLTVIFKAKGVTSNTVVEVLHYTGSEWEIVPSSAGNRTITATFNSLSPVAFVIKDVKSPGTGESSMMMWAIAAVAVGAAGIVVSKKRA